MVVCCNEDRQWKLLQFDPVNDEEVARAILDSPPDGMSDVTLGGIHCLALSYLYVSSVIYVESLRLLISCMNAGTWRQKTRRKQLLPS